MNIGYVIFGLAIVWVIYYLAWRHGASIGYHDGWMDGYKKGKDEGMTMGVKAGIKEQLLNNLAGTPREGALAELEQQVRRELLASMNVKLPPPAKPKKSGPSFLLELWQRFGWWAVLCGIIATTAYLAR